MTQQEVPAFTLSRQYEDLKSEIEPKVLEIMRSTYYIGGPWIKALEEDMCDYLGVKHAVSCANGSDALLLAASALEIGDGDEFITTPFTFFSTAGSLSRLGATPQFVDVREDTYNINEDLIEEAITPKTKAIVVVHLFGQMADMKKITELAEKHNLVIIEDAAQAIGAKYDDRPVGAFGDATTLSFYPTKNLGAAGDAGMVLANSDEVAGAARKYSKHGMNERYHHDVVGANSRMDSLQAGILQVKLKHLDDWTERRREIAQYYDERLNNVAEVITPKVDPKAHHVYHHYTIKAQKRDNLREYLKSKKIGTSLYYPVPLNQQECYKDLNQEESCPVAEHLSKTVLSLPIYPELSDDEISRVCSAIEEFYNGN